MATRHNVFVSYHHELDEAYRNRFEHLFGTVYGTLISKAVGDGDIDPNVKTETIRQKIRDEFIRDATVTVVLVGVRTWQRKHIDWEIASSIRDTERNPRCGLLGILLPTYPRSAGDKYDPHTVPPRLWDNIDCGYAKMYEWSEDPSLLSGWIEAAFARRLEMDPNNSRDQFAQNRTGDRRQ